MAAEIEACTRMETHGVLPARMNLAEGGGQVAVDTHNKGHARDAGHGRAHAAGVARRDQDGRKDSQEAELERDRSDGNGVKDAALGIDIGWRARATRIAKVPAMYIRAISAPAPKTARGSVRRGSRTSSLMAETSSRPVKAKAICDQKLTVSQFHVGIMLAMVKCVAEPCREADDRRDADQHQQGHIGAHAAGILQPLADVQADDIQHHSDQKHRQRDRQAERCGPARERRRGRR